MPSRDITKTSVRKEHKKPRLMPLKKAAEWLGLTTWGMRERIWHGDIPVVRFSGGRKQYIDIIDLEKFIQSHKKRY